MDFKELKNNSAFVLTLLLLALLLVPFALEQIGAATGAFTFPATKTVRGWFVSTTAAPRSLLTGPVDWERYRRDLETFTSWSDGQQNVAISLPRVEVETFEVIEEEKSARRVWSVPIVSCTAAEPLVGRKGYVFVRGFDRRFSEGDVIAPTQELCGYEVVFVGERTVWLRAVMDMKDDAPMGRITLPEFSRVEETYLVRGHRKYAVRDAFSLPSGGWLMIDSFMTPGGVLFKILDENRREVTSLLCVVLDERGGK